MNFEQILRALLASVFKMPVGDIDAILTASDSTEQTVEAAIMEREKARITALTQPRKGQTFQDGYAKAKAEERKLYEQELKAHFNIESDLTGAELMDHIVDSTTKAPDTTEEAIKKSPVYIQMERDLRKQLQTQKTEWETKWSERDNQDKKAKTFGSVSAKALEMLDGMNPAYPDDPKVAATWKNTFLKSLEGFDYEITGDDVTKAQVMKDGQLYTNEMGHNVSLEDLVKQQAPNYFTFKANNGGSNGGNGKGGNQGGSGQQKQGAKGYPEGVEKPKSFEEYSNLMNDRTIKLEDRRQISEAWEAEQQQGTK